MPSCDHEAAPAKIPSPVRGSIGPPAIGRTPTWESSLTARVPVSSKVKARWRLSGDQMGRLMDNYFGNSLKEVVNFLSEKRDLDVNELDEALKMLEDLKRQKDSKS